MIPAGLVPADGKWYGVTHRWGDGRDEISISSTDDNETPPDATTGKPPECYWCGEVITTPTIIYTSGGRNYEPICYSCHEKVRELTLI